MQNLRLRMIGAKKTDLRNLGPIKRVAKLSTKNEEMAAREAELIREVVKHKAIRRLKTSLEE